MNIPLRIQSYSLFLILILTIILFREYEKLKEETREFLREHPEFLTEELMKRKIRRSRNLQSSEGVSNTDGDFSQLWSDFSGDNLVQNCTTCKEEVLNPANENFVNLNQGGM